MRRFLIFGLAVMMGIATLVLMQVGLRPPPSADQAQPQGETAHVLVYARDLARGTLIDSTSLRWQEQLASALSAHAIVTTDPGLGIPGDMEGKVLRSNVMAGEAVRPELLADGAAGFMALTLSPGMRAVGLSVTEQTLAGGYVLPEDRVDLIHTTSGDFDGDGVASSFSQTILENIRVLAVGETPTGHVTFQTAEQQDATLDLPSDIRAKGETVTLEMTDEQAQILFSAQASGQLSLALRALDDQGPARIVSRIGLEDRPPAAAADPAARAERQSVATPAMPAEGPPQTASVRIIHGNTTSVIDVPVHRGPVEGTAP